MSYVLVSYLSFGIGMYVYAAVTNPKSFKDVDVFSIFMGIVGCIFWPVTLWIISH